MGCAGERTLFIDIHGVPDKISLSSVCAGQCGVHRISACVHVCLVRAWSGRPPRVSCGARMHPLPGHARQERIQPPLCPAVRPLHTARSDTAAARRVRGSVNCARQSARSRRRAPRVFVSECHPTVVRSFVRSPAASSSAGSNWERARAREPRQGVMVSCSSRSAEIACVGR